MMQSQFKAVSKYKVHRKISFNDESFLFLSFLFQGDKHAYTRCPLLAKSDQHLSPTSTVENSTDGVVDASASRVSPISRLSPTNPGANLSRVRETLIKRPHHLPPSSMALPVHIPEPALSSPPAFPAPPVPVVADKSAHQREAPMPPPIPPRGVKPMRPVPHPLLLSQIPPPPPPRLGSEEDDILMKLQSVKSVRTQAENRGLLRHLPCDSAEQNNSADRRDFISAEPLMCTTTEQRNQKLRGVEEGEAPLICLADDVADVGIRNRGLVAENAYGALFQRKINQIQGGSMRERTRPPAVVAVDDNRVSIGLMVWHD